MKWTAIEKFSIQGVNFLLGIIVARLLTPDDYGLVGMLGIFFAISQTLIDSGFSNALIRKLDCTNDDYCTVFYFNLVVSFLCMMAFMLGAPLIADFFHQPQLTAIARVSSINLFLGSFAGIQYAKLTKELNFKSQAKVNFISAVCSGVLGLIMAYMGYGVWAIVWPGIFANVIRTVLLFWIVKWWPSLIFSWKSFKELFNYGSKLMASGLLHTFYSEMTGIFIGRYYSAKALGNYSRGTGMASMPLNTLNSILSRVTFPIFAKMQNEDEKLIAVYRKYICLNALVVSFGCILMAALAEPIILILLGQKWAGAIIFLQIFAFAIMFDPLCALNLNLLQVKGRSDLFLRLEIIKKTISFAILLCAVPIGVIAICISKVIYTQIAVILNTYYTGKLFKLGYWAQMRDFMPFFLYSIISCLPAYLLTLCIPYHWVSSILGGISAVTIYVAILSFTKNATYQEFVQPYLTKAMNFISIKSKGVKTQED